MDDTVDGGLYDAHGQQLLATAATTTAAHQHCDDNSPSSRGRGRNQWYVRSCCQGAYYLRVAANNHLMHYRFRRRWLLWLISLAHSYGRAEEWYEKKQECLM
jgi:hypothetical protein